MRRVIAPALLALCMVAGNSASAGFGLFDGLRHGGCDSSACCEPVCGCEIVEPACGYEMVDPCCSPKPKFGGLLKKLFNKKHSHGCDMPACEPTCGCEIAPVDCGCAVIEPTCGIEPACGFEPACGCEPACGHGHKFGGLLKKLFKKDTGCCDPCGAAPTCGCEMAPSCGCGL